MLNTPSPPVTGIQPSGRNAARLSIMAMRMMPGNCTKNQTDILVVTGQPPRVPDQGLS